MPCETLARHLEIVSQFNGAVEITAGDFVRRRTALVMDIGFDDRDAECLAQLLVKMAGSCDRILVALCPWVEEVWRDISAADWTEWYRRGAWVIGSAQTTQKLIEVIQWAWTLPGRDTLLFVVARTEDWRPLQALFEDDHEDDGVNERNLVAAYPTILSRRYKAMNVRIVTREYDVDAIRALL